MTHTISKFALLVVAAAMSLSVLAQGMSDMPQLEMCQKMHPDMSAEQCQDMHKKMMDMHAANSHGHDTAANLFGQPGVAAQVVRTVKITMNDKFRYSPNALTVKQGDTVRFVVKNVGKIEHEMVIGRAQDIQAHHALMQKHPGMEHDEPHMISLEPGQQGELIWQFTQPGKFQFACLEPGHLEAGMKGRITVTPVKAATPAPVKPVPPVDHSGHVH